MVKICSDVATTKKKMQPNICIITTPRQKAGVTPLANFVDIIYRSSGELYLITGNEGSVVCKDRKNIHGHSIIYKAKTRMMLRIINYIYLQLWTSYRIIRLVRNVDIWIFFMAEELLLPLLTLKLLRKPIILNLASSAPKISETKKNISLIDKIPILSEIINYAISNKIILYSPKLIKEWELEKYRNKICIANEHFLDFDKFKIKKKFDERDNLIGYIGRLSEEKGTMNFVEAIPQMIKEKDGLQFLIGGDGMLREKIEKYLKAESLNDKVKLEGWIPHEKLPDYMNELRLIVLPSYTEGLPNIMLEAMACGTLVLATPVGAIPDVIKDGKTGFIMEDNSPECIAKNVMRALNHPNLEQLARNACAHVEMEFTYEKAVEKYRKILKDLS